MRRFEEMNPYTVTLYFLGMAGITMFTMNPLIIAISLFASILNYTLYAKGGVKPHLFSALLFLVLAILNPLLNHNGRTALFYLNDRPITAEATLYGVVAAGMVVASLYWLRLFAKLMTSDRLLYLFGRLSPKLSLILSSSIRYVELLRIRWRKILQTQTALGLYRDGNLIDALRGRARALSILITWALENGIVTAESMDARGYGTTRRTCFALYRIRIRDIAIMAVCVLLGALSITGLARCEVGYYPSVSMRLNDPLSITGAVCFCILSLLPVIINTKEAIRWHSLLSAR